MSLDKKTRKNRGKRRQILELELQERLRKEEVEFQKRMKATDEEKQKYERKAEQLRERIERIKIEKEERRRMEAQQDEAHEEALRKINFLPPTIK